MADKDSVHKIVAERELLRAKNAHLHVVAHVRDAELAYQKQRAEAAEARLAAAGEAFGWYAGEGGEDAIDKTQVDTSEYNSLLLALGFAVGLLVKHKIPLEPEITDYLRSRGYKVD